MPSKILVVDDSPVVLRLLEQHLRRAGHPRDRIYTARSGESAVSVFEEFRPETVLLDVHMDGIGGEVTARHILETEPETRVVVVTGMGDADERVRRMIAMGVFEVLEKPVHSEDVQALLKKIELEASSVARIR